MQKHIIKVCKKRDMLSFIKIIVKITNFQNGIIMSSDYVNVYYFRLRNLYLPYIVSRDLASTKDKNPLNICTKYWLNLYDCSRI